MNTDRKLHTDFTAIDLSKEIEEMKAAASQFDGQELQAVADMMANGSADTETVGLITGMSQSLASIADRLNFTELAGFCRKAIDSDLPAIAVQEDLDYYRIADGVSIVVGDGGPFFIVAHQWDNGTGYGFADWGAAARRVAIAGERTKPCLDNTDNAASSVQIARDTATGLYSIDGFEGLWSVSIDLKRHMAHIVSADGGETLVFDNADLTFKTIAVADHDAAHEGDYTPIELYSAADPVPAAEVGVSPVTMMAAEIDDMIGHFGDAALAGLEPFTQYNGMLVRMTANNRNDNPVYHVFNQHFTALPRHLRKDRRRRAKAQILFNVSENVRLMPMRHSVKDMNHIDFIIDLNSLNKVSPLFQGAVADVKVYLLYGGTVEE